MTPLNVEEIFFIALNLLFIKKNTLKYRINTIIFLLIISMYIQSIVLFLFNLVYFEDISTLHMLLLARYCAKLQKYRAALKDTVYTFLRDALRKRREGGGRMRERMNGNWRGEGRRGRRSGRRGVPAAIIRVNYRAVSPFR